MKTKKPKPPRCPGPTEAITEICSRVFAGNGSLRDAARFTGISHETLRRWRKKGRAGDSVYKVFAAACDKGLTIAKLRTLKRAEERDPRWVLVVRHGMKDKPTQIEIAGELKVKTTRDMTREELLAEIASLHDDGSDQ